MRIKILLASMTNAENSMLTSKYYYWLRVIECKIIGGLT